MTSGAAGEILSAGIFKEFVRAFIRGRHLCVEPLSGKGTLGSQAGDRMMSLGKHLDC